MSQAISSSPHLTDDLLTALVDGQLSDAERTALHLHAEQCVSCRGLLAAVVGGSAQDPWELVGLDSPETWTPPPEFGGLRLEQLLGRGAMGVVYRARDVALDRRVAVKFIAIARPDGDARARFTTEARAIARMHHPNVVTLFSQGEVEGHPYLVSEYIQGRTFAELERPLHWRRVLSLGVQLVRGLTAAHQHGVLHRDLKPSNVLLTDAGEVKLIDFGLAELLDPVTFARAAGKRSLAGTRRYMAPEVLGFRSATPRSDVYAVGLILEELLLRPDAPASRALPEHVPDLAPGFATLIERCLREQPQERFGSAEALLRELERLDAPAPERHPGNPYRGLAPFEAEHRASFFGREDDVDRVLERLRYQTLVLVAGDSGVGKSSLCRAGLVPRVAQGDLELGARMYTCVTLTPGRRPRAALAAALAPVLDRTEAELDTVLAHTPEQLGRRLREGHLRGAGLLLFVDQLEELLTLAEPTEAVAVARLLGALSLPGQGVRVLLTVRGDFLTRLGALPGLGEAVESALYLLRPLRREQMERAVVAPARARGVDFESEDLVRRLVEEATKDSGGLPLLQFTLAELWARRDAERGLLRQADLDALGGVAGALSRHGDEVLARLTPGQHAQARQLLVRLVTPEGTRRERGEMEVLGADPDAPAALHALVQGRLLHTRTRPEGAHYGLAHESLIERWRTLRDWLDEDAGRRALVHRLELASAEWRRMDHARDTLWRGRQLDEVRALEPSRLAEPERHFLLASRRALSRRRRARVLGGVLGVVGLAALYGGWRLSEWWDVQRLSQETTRAALATLQDEAPRLARQQTLREFDAQPPDAAHDLSDMDRRRLAERRWTDTLARYQRSADALDEALFALDVALERVPGHAEARRQRLVLLAERIVLSEDFHQPHDAVRQRFERLSASDATWRGWLTRPARLHLTTHPSGARVEVLRYVTDAEGRMALAASPAHTGVTPLHAVPLPPGAYHLRITHPGSETLDYPVLLKRDEDTRLDQTLPARPPEGLVYIPPGCFFIGGAEAEDIRVFMKSAPLHEHCLTQGYYIQRDEVTFGDWVDYLEAQPPSHPDRALFATIPDAGNDGFTLDPDPRGGWRFTFRWEGQLLVSDARGLLANPVRADMQKRAWALAAGLVPFAPPERPAPWETPTPPSPLRVPGGPWFETSGYRPRDYHAIQRWRRLPLAGISSDTLHRGLEPDSTDVGYLKWLDSTGRLPGARLCGELEWTRAARGADPRRYPHGNRFHVDDANIDATYDRTPGAFGPDEVGLHPASTSPFGVRDMSGNAYETTRAWTRDLGADGDVLLGGAWYYGTEATHIASRQYSNPSQAYPLMGVRLCGTPRSTPRTGP
ncbi:bifunctional serine/threonine-protein kinase/formylglycine-generating enzyme family protein [Archangium primigenium]|uniref:bifunctional serine/threonine-protein kinase/formylglycine-generating enzyme family protein n=1 Tax=[Archangium] primigenium TaxID=2792470 RepID=UPI00195F0CAD|nr:bifunctional serine/threonine-protein kinase/formylglycine-generating enzyme family protein [Archangium primigenium]MBM7112628.1 protein kinase [Archangium primigenium]